MLLACSGSFGCSFSFHFLFFCKPFQRTHRSLFPGLASFSGVLSGRISGSECLRWGLSRLSAQKYGAVSRINGSCPSSIFPCSTLFVPPIAVNSVTVRSREPDVPSNLPLVVALYQEYDRLPQCAPHCKCDPMGSIDEVGLGIWRIGGRRVLEPQVSTIAKRRGVGCPTIQFLGRKEPK